MGGVSILHYNRLNFQWVAVNRATIVRSRTGIQSRRPEVLAETCSVFAYPSIYCRVWNGGLRSTTCRLLERVLVVGAFETKLVEMCLLVPSYLSVRLLATTSVPKNGFLWNLVIGNFTNTCRHIQILVKTGAQRDSEWMCACVYGRIYCVFKYLSEEWMFRAEVIEKMRRIYWFNLYFFLCCCASVNKT